LLNQPLSQVRKGLNIPDGGYIEVGDTWHQ